MDVSSRVRYCGAEHHRCAGSFNLRGLFCGGLLPLWREHGSCTTHRPRSQPPNVRQIASAKSLPGSAESFLRVEKSRMGVCEPLQGETTLLLNPRSFPLGSFETCLGSSPTYLGSFQAYPGNATFQMGIPPARTGSVSSLSSFPRFQLLFAAIGDRSV